MNNISSMDGHMWIFTWLHSANVIRQYAYMSTQPQSAPHSVHGTFTCYTPELTSQFL